MRDFDLTYSAYAGCAPHGALLVPALAASGGRAPASTPPFVENLVKLDHLPLLQRVPSAPELKPGQRIRLDAGNPDFLTLEPGLPLP